MFLSTPPSRVATLFGVVKHTPPYVSIHATLAGGDDRLGVDAEAEAMFLSTPPSRVATTLGGDYIWHLKLFLSTPPSRVATCYTGDFRSRRTRFYPRHPRGWRRAGNARHHRAGDVSIHATLAGGDTRAYIEYVGGKCFYPRHPRGWRPAPAYHQLTPCWFLSTPPSRVATTLLKSAMVDNFAFLSTPPSRVATAVGADAQRRVMFLSTPPSRVAT